MFWFMVAALVVVVLAVALVVLGAGGSMSEPTTDRAPQALPADRPLGRPDLVDVRFAVVPRGYRMDEVDQLLDRLGAELELRDARLRAAEQPRGAADEAPSGASLPGSAPRGRDVEQPPRESGRGEAPPPETG